MHFMTPSFINTPNHQPQSSGTVRSLFAIVVLWGAVSPALAQFRDIKIINSGVSLYKMTSFDAGPCIGEILNAHYFPGLEFYRTGFFTQAMNEMNYTLDRPTYTEGNPRQGEFLGNAHFLRGMIYFHHASGVGRLLMAKKEFEQAIRWHPKHFDARLELARIWSAVGQKQRAIVVLKKLLELNPDEAAARTATQELKLLETEATKQ